MRHLSSFNAGLGSAYDQSFRAKVRWNFDQQIAAPCTVLTGCSSRFESLNDGIRLSHTSSVDGVITRLMAAT